MRIRVRMVVYVLIGAFGLFVCCGFGWQGVKAWVLPAEPIDRHVAAPGPGCGDRYLAGADGGYKDRWDQYGVGASVTCARDHSVMSGFSSGPADTIYTVVSTVDNKRVTDVADDGFRHAAVEVTTTVAKGGPQARGGIVLLPFPPDSRSFDPAYDLVYFSMRGSGHWTVTYTRDFGPPETERAAGDAPGGGGGEHTLRLQIEARSSTLVFFVDGTEVARLQHPRIDKYLFGLGVSCDVAEQHGDDCAASMRDYRYQVR